MGKRSTKEHSRQCLRLEKKRVSHDYGGREYRSFERSGNLIAEIYWFLYSGVQFASYEAVQELAGNTVHSSFISGALSASITTLVTYPCDLLRTRFVYQGNERLYRHIISGTHSIIQSEGFFGLYKVSFVIIFNI
jgi:mitochondrial thiamine pyrophosphate carrier 1